MTKEEILAMPAGRELDALVAEKVMGWKLRQVGNGSMDGEYYWHDGSDFVDGRLANLEFSIDISAAWEVVEKTKIAIIPQSTSAPEDMKYLARVEEDFRQDEIEVFATTAPEAICKAALLAVMGV